MVALKEKKFCDTIFRESNSITNVTDRQKKVIDFKRKLNLNIVMFSLNC